MRRGAALVILVLAGCSTAPQDAGQAPKGRPEDHYAHTSPAVPPSSPPR